MERRIAELSIGPAGETASKGSKTRKTILPTETDCSLNGVNFVELHQEQGHDVRILRYYDDKTLCSTIYADFTDQTLVVENEDVLMIKTAFGNNRQPNWRDFQNFLLERCIPRQRAGLREYLEAWGLEEYDPILIIQKTEGRMAEDQQWLTIEVCQ